MKKGFLSLSSTSLLMLLLAPCAGAFSLTVDPAPLTRVFDNFNDGIDTTASLGSLTSLGEAGGVTSLEMPALASDPKFTLPTPGSPFSATTYPYLRVRAQGSVAGGDGIFPAPAAGPTRIPYSIGTSYSEFQAAFINVAPGINGTALRIDPAGGGTAGIETFDFDYIMLDQVQTIGLGEFDRDGTLDGWGLTGITGSSSASTSAFAGSMVSSDPQMQLTGINIDTTVFQTIEIRMALDAASTSRAEIFWGTNTFPGPVGGQSVILTSELIRDGAMHTYRIDMTDEAAWDGNLNLLRLDPLAESGRTVEVDYIRVLGIPEPSSFMLLCLGALTALRRRR